MKIRIVKRLINIDTDRQTTDKQTDIHTHANIHIYAYPHISTTHTHIYILLSGHASMYSPRPPTNTTGQDGGNGWTGLRANGKTEEGKKKKAEYELTN